MLFTWYKIVVRQSKNHIAGIYELIYSPIWNRVASLLMRKSYDWHHANKMRCTCTVYLLLHRTFHVPFLHIVWWAWNVLANQFLRPPLKSQYFLVLVRSVAYQRQTPFGSSVRPMLTTQSMWIDTTSGSWWTSNYRLNTQTARRNWDPLYYQRFTKV